MRVAIAVVVLLLIAGVSFAYQANNQLLSEMSELVDATHSEHRDNCNKLARPSPACIQEAYDFSEWNQPRFVHYLVPFSYLQHDIR